MPDSSGDSGTAYGLHDILFRTRAVLGCPVLAQLDRAGPS